MTTPDRPVKALVVTLAVLVALGVATKLYSGPAAGWVRGSAGGLFYVAFFSILVLALRPDWAAWKVAGLVFLATSGLEVLQLWHPPALERVRSTFVGQTLIGGHFSWQDLPFYAVGALVAVGIAGRLRVGGPGGPPA